MRIMVDLDPKDVWRIQNLAQRRGVTPGEVLRDEIAKSRKGRDAQEAIRQRVIGGMCDADIAGEIGATPGWVADMRRGMGLPANRRYSRANGLCANGHVVAEDSRTDSDGRVKCRGCERSWGRTRRAKNNRVGRDAGPSSSKEEAA